MCRRLDLDARRQAGISRWKVEEDRRLSSGYKAEDSDGGPVVELVTPGGGSQAPSSPWPVLPA